MIKYNEKDYSSKADIVRDLYNQGSLTLEASSKKKIAKELEMTVQTVHATIMKFLNNSNKVVKSEKVKKINVAVEQANNRLNQKIERTLSTEGPIFINDKSDEVKEILMKDPRKILINFSPNQWSMPVCSSLYVIDDNYDPNWVPDPEDQIHKLW